MIWTGAFALLALLISAQQIDGSLSALRQLAGVHLNEAFSVKQRCRTYENLLASSNPPPAATMGRDQLFRSILDGLQSHETAALDSNEARVFNDLRECLGLAAKPAAPSSQVAATPLTPATKTAPATTFDRADLVALSRAQQETKGLPLHARCQTLSETLKSVFADNADYLALASRDGLMATTIAELSARQLPFGNSQPVLAALQECVTNFPEFQAGGAAAHQRLNVIAAPVKNVAPAATGGSPMQRAHEEFNKVKNNVKDFGQDLYSGGGNGGATGHQPHGLNQAHRHEQPLGESHHASHQAGHHASHSPTVEANTELERKFAEVLQKFNSERSRRESLEHELEQERSARAQLEAHSADLERELAYAQQLLSQQVGRVHPRYLVDNDDDDDDDDDDDEDDIERRQGKLKDLVNKDKAGKKDKKDKKKDKEGEEKVYEDPVDIARKLQDKMNASERPESRCQKYYMALNYPGKVGKKFIKWLAKLPLPGAAIAPEAHYYESLANYVQVLARSRNKNSRLAARELEQCLEIHSSAPIYDHHHHQPPPQYQHHSLGPNEIPVEDVRTRGGGGFVHPPPVLYDDLRPGAQEIPVTFANAGVKPGKKVHNWSYAHASASSGAGPRFPELPPFPDFY